MEDMETRFREKNRLFTDIRDIWLEGEIAYRIHDRISEAKRGGGADVVLIVVWLYSNAGKYYLTMNGVGYSRSLLEFQ